MSLTRVVDAFAAFLASEMTDAPANVGGVRPANAGDLPTVAISIRQVEQKLIALGARPAPSRVGSLAVSQSFDLTEPTVTFPDGETVVLLSADRRSLHFPFGPVVAADGTEVASLSAADLTVSIDGAPLAVVAPEPGAGQVSGVPDLGELHFGDPAPVAGALRVDFFIGEWEVETARYQGELMVEAFASSGPGVLALSADVDTTLLAARQSGLAGLQALHPLSLGSAAVGTTPPSMRVRELVYAFDFELEDPKLGTGGGIIDFVAVRSDHSTADDSQQATELFEVPALI